MYDSSLSQKTLDLLMYAPILYMIMATWLFSNQQVFRNVVPEIKDNYLYPLTQHQFTDLVDDITPATPFVILIGIGVIGLVIKVFGMCCKGD